MSEPTASEPRPGLSRLAAPLFLLPALLHLLGRGGEGWYLVLLALALARLAGGRSDARTWAAGVAFSFVLPLWPVIAHLFGFQLERVLVHGALFTLAWRGRLRPAPVSSRWIRSVRAALLLWLAWSAGCALRGFAVDLPPDAPWVGALLRAQLLGLLTELPMTEATHPLAVFSLRLETVLLAWVGFELGLRGSGPRRWLARFAAVAVPAGLVTAWVEMWRGAAWRGESLLDRLAQGIGRGHRPLTDHNALGSALVLLLPVLAWLLASRLLVPLLAPGPAGEPGRRPSRPLGWLSAVALLAGLALLYTSKSKSAIGALVLAAPLFAAVYLVASSTWARRAAAVLGALALAVGAYAALDPGGLSGVLRATGPGAQLVDRVENNGFTWYLRENRFPVWRAAAGMVADEPLPVSYTHLTLPTIYPV